MSRDTSRAANGYGGASLTDGTRARCRRAAARPMRGIHPPKMRSVVESIYHVLGMSCDHCVQSVTSALGALPGVREVTVDLAAALVTVRSDTPPPPDAVRRAVDEAGFELTEARP
ncbi:heavy-metal-associated domain-containing protein [Micromonospora maritima]|uniref:heavy-metal-associated domain-containing protein n=1 Tax=Micromonospora maritima TaxID=986711 RepID=UPI00378C6606